MTTPLVMIHGLLGPIDFFEPATLLRDIPVHTPALLGYGHQGDDISTPLTLAGQAAHVARYLQQQVNQPAYVLGHSVGGAIAMLLASQYPHLVKGIISVEGNFTLNDAFWCRRIAPLDAATWAAEYAQTQSDPVAWLDKGGIIADKQRLQWAKTILANQPASTVQAMAQAVVKETAEPAFLEHIRKVLTRTPVWLLAGEKSAAGWDVPDWTRKAARASAILPGTGHMMMLEKPKEFCGALRGMLY
ncbi:2-succinyl-6-hydroxy-2,4-cyclohexadiene-1-carboxylate synthase [Andreprevotia sp. IGB-42]|uniref:alpha/beta fold hydrolase n=1 Tax=Andreprevotia sp. IGB-42 TaxID=2497473 RepID=UPI00135A95B5|nr:alpha/beta hydrolase [Andreprevotia sp. IGB-42]KAF0812235.1 2-succinyl-6-hydroxy-2,4-cyclohexadiene-1-carboxylate synthase [Andreprevotia sp. IGB-42]